MCFRWAYLFDILLRQPMSRFEKKGPTGCQCQILEVKSIAESNACILCWKNYMQATVISAVNLFVAIWSGTKCQNFKSCLSFDYNVVLVLVAFFVQEQRRKKWMKTGHFCVTESLCLCQKKQSALGREENKFYLARSPARQNKKRCTLSCTLISS